MNQLEVAPSAPPSVPCRMRIARFVDPRLDRIVHALVEGVQPERVILFGSRARGDARSDSDYDLVVEIGFDDYHDCYGRVSRAVRSAVTDADVDVLIRRPGQIESRRDDPGYLDWQFSRDGLVLYPADASSTALRPHVRVVREEERSATHQSITDWLARAAEDLRDIENSLAAGERASWSGVCFHAEQLAEKHLKVLFIQRNVPPPRTHDLATLVAGLTGLGYRVPDVRRECALLEPYAVGVRYPEDVAIPNEAMGREVLAAAHIIVGIATELRHARERR